MDRLPPELVEHISHFLDPEDLKNTLTISRDFRYASERYCGAYKSFTLHSSDESRKRLRNVYKNHPRRISYLREVHVHTTLPDLRFKKSGTRNDVVVPLDFPCREPREELDENDRIFTKQICFAFDTLKALEEEALAHGYGPGRIKLTIHAPTRHVDKDFCLHRRYSSWRIHLLSPRALPKLASIRSLHVNAGYNFDVFDHWNMSTVNSKMEPSLMLDLAGKLPELESMDWIGGGEEWSPPNISAYLSHYYRNYEGPRRDSRHSFAEAIESILPKGLRNASLDFLYPLSHVEAMDQCGHLPNLVAPSLYGDPFSTALRRLSYQLRRLELRVMADSTLFWPSSSSETPSWPNLEILRVCFHMASPSGEWYFQGPSGEDPPTSAYAVQQNMYPPLEVTEDDEIWHHYDFDTGLWPFDQQSATWTSFRVAPLEATMTPFLTAFAKAAAQMKKLKDFKLWAPLKWNVGDIERIPIVQHDLFTVKDTHEDLAWGLAYAAPSIRGSPIHSDAKISTVRKMRWRTARWRPSRQLHDLFRKIGEHDGSELMETWGEVGYGDGLVGRKVFES